MRVPRRSQVGVFNRSHYEDVLITRVHKEIDADTCKARYEQIRDFEAELFDSGTHILKFFLRHQRGGAARPVRPAARRPASQLEDQRSRLYRARVLGRFHGRLSGRPSARRGTKDAPWFVIPSNHKWFRNLAISQIVGDTLEDLGMKYPKPHIDLAKIRHDYHAAVAEADGKKKRKG